MILNLLRVEDLKVEDMIKRSFSEVENARSRPEQSQDLKEVWARRCIAATVRAWD